MKNPSTWDDSAAGTELESPAAVLAGRYRRIRAMTESLCRPLHAEDYVVQSMPDASPAKWHLGHVSWFFETFVLSKAHRQYTVFHPGFSYLFNSYYLTAGPRHCRPRRGLLSRPTVDQVMAYRKYVDEHMLELLENAPPEQIEELAAVIEVGLHHEQQHQELLLTDLLHLFWSNPLRPAYSQTVASENGGVPALTWLSYPEGVVWIGHSGSDFAYDNEKPRHQEFVASFALATRLVTNGEFRAFIDDGGYQRGELWLADGWAKVQAEQWAAPLYWEKDGANWMHMTLAGMQHLDEAQPAAHLSYFEAEAYARWAGARLPTEAQWELASEQVEVTGNLLDSGLLQPTLLSPESPEPTQMIGDVWEWTQSAYLPYPGFQPMGSGLGEYNGKFMCNQFVLRGGSCLTPASHIRRTYRNFFPPDARWQCAGLRLARDL